MASFSSYEESSFSSSSGLGGLALGAGSFSLGADLGLGISSGASYSSGASFSSSGSAEAVAEAALASSVAAAAAAGASLSYSSSVEQALLSASAPAAIDGGEEISVLGNRGIWVNKAEVNAWSGAIPISAYTINQDASPEVITKSAGQSIEYVQELAVRYLRPPTPPTPGEIIIVQEANVSTGPAPPLIIRQQPARPATPAPLVIREAPPAAPASVGRKLITISGRRLPPPPRKVIIERLAPLPSKPQSVLIERWLAYGEVKRKVIFRRAAGRDAVFVKPRNVIIQWSAPAVSVRKEFKNLGVILANPADYVARYGSSLIASGSLPSVALEIAAPAGLTLAANYRAKALFDLEGDVAALGLINLEANGLGAYSSYLSGLGVSAASAASQFGITQAVTVAQGVAASSAVQYGLGASVGALSSYSASAVGSLGGFGSSLSALAYGGDASSSSASFAVSGGSSYAVESIEIDSF